MTRYVNPPGSCFLARKFFTGSVTWSSASTAGFWTYYTFTAGNGINNFNELAAVFDEYRVYKVKYTFVPGYDSVDMASTAQAMPLIHTLVDPASTVTPTGTFSSTTINTFLENQGVVSRKFDRPISVIFRPKIFQTAEGTVAAATMTSTRWTKTNDTLVQYRGLHVLVQPSGGIQPSNLRYDTFIQVYMRVRNPR